MREDVCLRVCLEKIVHWEVFSALRNMLAIKKILKATQQAGISRLQ